MLRQVWADYTPETEAAVVEVEEPTERSVKYTTVVVTEVADDLKFYAQNVDNGRWQRDLIENLTPGQATFLC